MSQQSGHFAGFALFFIITLVVLAPVWVAGADSGILEKSAQPSNIISVEPVGSNEIRDEPQVTTPVTVVTELPMAAPSALPVVAPEIPVAIAPATRATPNIPAPVPAAAPDETSLWEALRTRRFDEVSQRIETLQAEYPAWQPPAQLRALVDRGRLEQRIKGAMSAGDATALLELEARHPEMFSCEHMDRAWAAADAAAQSNRKDQLNRLLARLIPHCRAADRLVTLQKARDWLDVAAWDALAQKEQLAQRPAGIDDAFKALLLDDAMRRLQQAAGSEDAEEFDILVDKLAGEIERRRDAGTAVLVAWRLLKKNDSAGAGYWFDKARSWDATLTDPPYGLALCAMYEGNFVEARNFARTLPESHPDRARLLGQAALALAELARQQGDTSAALDLYRESASYTEMPRYGRAGWAWSSLQSGHEADAALAFSSLYTEAPDLESARGLMTAYLALDRGGELEALARTEPLASLMRVQRAQGAFAQKRFLLAGSLAPDEFGALGTPAAPRVTWHSALRDKSGEPGLSRLTDSIHGAEAVYSPWPASEIRMRVDYHILDSGGLDALSRESFARSLLAGTRVADPRDSGFNSLVIAAGNSLRLDGAQGHVGGIEPLLTWRRESRFNLEATLGLTLSGGVSPPRAIGRIAISGNTRESNYTVAAFMRPIRESVLSYTGLRLNEILVPTPFTGERWGAVRGAGIEANGYRALGKGFSVSGRMTAERVDGKNVRGNDHLATTINLGRSLPVPGMDYTVAGVNFSYDHYEHNLSRFTPGHGGYFSPQNFWQAKATLDFQTLENRQALLKAHLDGGRVFKREAAAPMIPLDGFEEFGTLPGSRTWGWSWGVELAAAVRVGDHMQLGANFSRRESPQYDETAGMLFLRVMFEPRKSVLSADLATQVLEGMR